MNQKIFITDEFVSQIVKSMDLTQLIYLQNRIKIVSLLQFEYVALYISFQEDYPFFQVHLGPNVNSLQQNLINAVNIIQERRSQQFDLKLIQQKKEFQQFFKQQQQNNQKVEIIYEYLKFVSKQFIQYKWNLLDNEIHKYQLYSYLLEEVDYVTKSQLIFPSFWLKQETLLLPPALINQETFFDHLIRAKAYEQKRILSQYNKISNLIIIYLFEIRNLLQQVSKTKLQIQIYPSLLNFNFIRKDNGQPYFLNKSHFELFVLQNSRAYSQSRKNINYFAEFLENNNKITLNLFNYYPSDEIGKGLILVQNNEHREENAIQFQQYWKQMFQKKYPNINNVESLQIQAVSLNYIHSLDCKVNNPLEYVKHIIDTETMICKYCKEQINDYGTLFYDLTFYQFYQGLRDILLSPYYKDIPGVYICPITLVLKGTKNNYYISSQILNQNQEHLITLYNQMLKFEFHEQFDDASDEDEKYYEVMNAIRDRNLEKILNDLSDDDLNQ